MKQDDFAAALTRLLEPTTAELAEEDTVVPYWAMSAEARGIAPAGPVGADFAPDLAQFLSDGLAADVPRPKPPLADIVAYVDGELEGSDREAFEAALVASPELRAEVDMLFDRVALFASEDDVGVEPASPLDRSDKA